MEKLRIIGNNGKIVTFASNRAVVVTPSNTVRFAPGVLYIGTGGNVKVLPQDNTEFVTFMNVADGTFLSIDVIAVHTDTTAGDILLLY